MLRGYSPTSSRWHRDHGFRQGTLWATRLCLLWRHLMYVSSCLRFRWLYTPYCLIPKSFNTVHYPGQFSSWQACDGQWISWLLFVKGVKCWGKLFSSVAFHRYDDETGDLHSWSVLGSAVGNWSFSLHTINCEPQFHCLLLFIALKHCWTKTNHSQDVTESIQADSL